MKTAKAMRVTGFSLIESLVAMAIFSLGVLGLIGMYASAVGSVSESQFRSEAAAYANEMMGNIWASVPRAAPNYDVDMTVLGSFATNATGTDCGAFSGIESLHAEVVAWKGRLGAAGTGLPKAGLTTHHQIAVENAAGLYNRVRITVCWQSPRDANVHKYELVSFIN